MTGTHRGSECSGTATVTLYDLKKIEINDDEKIRLARGLPLDNPDLVVSKQQYDDQFDKEEVRIRDLEKLEFQGSILLAYTTQATGVVGLPKKHSVDRRLGKPLQTFFDVVVKGDLIKGGKLLPTSLRDVRVIYGVERDLPLDEVAFRHAQNENSPSVWRWFETQYSTSRRVAAARTARQTATLECARIARQDYVDGKCPRLLDARKLLAEAELIAKDQSTADMREALDKAEAESRRRVTEIAGLVQSGRFDLAVEQSRVGDFARKFSECYSDLAKLSATALQNSHDEHVTSGSSLSAAGRFADALKQFEIALDRKPDSASARAGWCGAKEGAVLNDVELLLRARSSDGHQKAADSIQEALRIDCLTTSSRLATTLAGVRDEWGEILFQEADALITVSGPPPKRAKLEKPLVLFQDETAYRTAKSKFELARRISPKPMYDGRLASVNAKLAAFRVKEATKALSAQRIGTAAVHLQQAIKYDSSDQATLATSDEVRAKLREKTEFSIGVYFEDLSKQTNLNLAELLAESLRTTLARTGDFAVVDPTVARAFYQEYERTGQVPPRFAERPYFFLIGKVFELNVRREERQQQLQGSERVGRNGSWDQLDRYYRQWDDEYDRLRRALGERHAQTQAAKNQRDQYKRERDKYPEWTDVPYSFMRRDVGLAASTRVFFRLVDCVTGRILDGDEIREDRKWTDHEHIGIRVNDVIYQPKELSLPDSQSVYRALQEHVEQRIASKGGEYLARLPVETYYNRAMKSEAGGLEPKAVEEYILFLYSTRRSTSPEAQRARRYVKEKLFLEAEDVVGDSGNAGPSGVSTIQGGVESWSETQWRRTENTNPVPA